MCYVKSAASAFLTVEKKCCEIRGRHLSSSSSSEKAAHSSPLGLDEIDLRASPPPPKGMHRNKSCQTLTFSLRINILNPNASIACYLVQRAILWFCFSDALAAVCEGQRLGVYLLLFFFVCRMSNQLLAPRADVKPVFLHEPWNAQLVFTAIVRMARTVGVTAHYLATLTTLISHQSCPLCM